jgi:predicted DNA-binding transcriptional regulator AlpA
VSQPLSEAKTSSWATQSLLSDESLVTSKRLRELLGDCSEMHIWRLLNDEKNQALAFPRPIKINDRNYWRLGAVRQWICERENQSQIASNMVLRAVPRSKPTEMPRDDNSRTQIRRSKRARRCRASKPLRYPDGKVQQGVNRVPAVVRRKS